MSLTADELLRYFPLLLTGGGDQASDRLVAWLQQVTLEAGQVLLEQDQDNDSLFLLFEGRMKLQLQAEGRRLILGEVDPGGWVGELSLLRPAPASATVTALESCVLYKLSHTDLEALRRAWPETASALIHTVALTLVERLRSSAAQLIRPVGERTFALGPVADRGGPAGLV